MLLVAQADTPYSMNILPTVFFNMYIFNMDIYMFIQNEMLGALSKELFGVVRVLKR